MIDVVDLATAVLEIGQHLEDGENVLLAQHANLIARLAGIKMRGRQRAEARVHLHPADSGQVIALVVEEQPLEQGFRRVQRRRLARAHDAIDVDQGFLARAVAIARKRIADVRTDVDVIDGKRRNRADLGRFDLFHRFGGQFVARLHEDFAGRLVDQIARRITADQIVEGHQHLLQPAVLEFLGQACGDFGARLGHDLAGLGVDQVAHQLDRAQARGVEGRLPALLGMGEDDRVVEITEDLL